MICITVYSVLYHKNFNNVKFHSKIFVKRCTKFFHHVSIYRLYIFYTYSIGTFHIVKGPHAKASKSQALGVRLSWRKKILFTNATPYYIHIWINLPKILCQLCYLNKCDYRHCRIKMLFSLKRAFIWSETIGSPRSFFLSFSRIFNKGYYNCTN